MNNEIFFFFYKLAHQSVFFDALIVFLGVHLPFILGFSALVFAVFGEKQASLRIRVKEIFLVFCAPVAAWIVATLLKIWIHTPRPFDAFPYVQSLFPETGYAFPSRHAIFFFTLALVIYAKNKTVGYIFISSAILIGLARVIAGVHFPIDILGGFVIGFVISSVFLFFSKRIPKTSGEEKQK